MNKSLVLILLFLCGCASVSYENKEEKFVYSRMGSQTLTGLEVQRGSEGLTKFKLKGNQADLGEIGQVMTDLAKEAAKAKSP